MQPIWFQLREWNNSKENAFEELVCQVAHGLPMPAGSRFTRVGRPDGGVESYWRLPSGEEIGYQAKFFTGTPGPDQWRQIEKSYKRALATHPDLVEYVVCLPSDPADPRDPGTPTRKPQKSFTDRWNFWKAKWEKLALDQGRTVEVKFWGDHEILSPLQSDLPRGRFRWWFEIEELNAEWFRDHLQKSITLAGPRYTPDCHVELPVSARFEALTRDPCFSERVTDGIAKVERRLREALSRSVSELQGFAAEITDLVAQFEVLRSDFDEIFYEPLPFDRLADLLEDAENIIARAHEELWRVESASDVRTGKEVEQEGPTHHPPDQISERKELPASEAAVQESRPENAKLVESSASSPAERSASTFELTSLPGERERHQSLGGAHYRLRTAHEAVDDLWRLVSAGDSLLANGHVLLITGEPGAGKTHLFCDIARERISRGLPTVVLFGQRFRTNTRPLAQAYNQLDLSFASDDEFLGALEAAAHPTGQPALILIDVL